MSEIQRWKHLSNLGEMIKKSNGDFVLLTDHLAALEALKAPTVSMREHAEAIVDALLLGKESDIKIIETYLNEHLARERKDAETKS